MERSDPSPKNAFLLSSHQLHHLQTQASLRSSLLLLLTSLLRRRGGAGAPGTAAGDDETTLSGDRVPPLGPGAEVPGAGLRQGVPLRGAARAPHGGPQGRQKLEKRLSKSEVEFLWPKRCETY